MGCAFANGIYSGGSIEITNCLGHLYNLFEPEDYDEKFKPWDYLPVIPEKFLYAPHGSKSRQASIVRKLLRNHKNDEILIATDADREGEIIARECLIDAGITDLSKAKRFWVSQALTKEVILDGVKNAKPIQSSEYDKLARQGFARQHSDWLTGYNFTRYISNAAKRKLPVGRVQTAVLSAIEERCSQIENFESKKYFEHWGEFSSGKSSCKGIYFDGEKTQFPDDALCQKLSALTGENADLSSLDAEKKEVPSPQLYNLNELQKDAFKSFGYSAEQTLTTVQKLYEEKKCVSYPRTPSRVMGSQNVELCKKIFLDLSKKNSNMAAALEKSDFSLANKRVFNDAKLEAHHALIPLAELPDSASEAERNVYNLILSRFAIAFLPPYVYEKQTAVVTVGGYTFRILGRKPLDLGWKKFQKNTDNADNGEEDGQDISSIDWNNLILSNVETLEKWTRPPRYFNEASILAFMENPKSEDESAGKLVGLGTPATRHTFIPKLLESEYIEISKKNILITTLGKSLLSAIRTSGIKSIADISETTSWEKRLDSNPEEFEIEIKQYVKESVAVPFSAEIKGDKDFNCPKCGKPLKRNSYGWFCSAEKEQCGFKVWGTIAGTKLSEKDAENLFSGKSTTEKKFTSKSGKKFSARLAFDEKLELKFVFAENTENANLSCPKCGKPLKKNSYGWFCSAEKDQCDFKIWGVVANAKLTDKDVKTLCTGGKTAEKKFKSKAGKEFKARLFLSEEKKVEFEFQKNK